jgi:hypothetical protein
MSFDHLKRDFIGLPMASILQKIERHNPDAIPDIIDFAEMRRREYLQAEIQVPPEEPVIKTPDTFTLWHGLRKAFNLFGLFEEKKAAPPHETVRDTYYDNDAWAHIGNDMRFAIRTYLLTHGDVLSKIEITPQEAVSLAHVPASAFIKAQRHLSR